MSIVYIGIGSNIGNRHEQCRLAVELLRRKGVEVRKISPEYETKPWGVANQPPFINLAVEAYTNVSPQELLGVLKEIENEMGRETSIRWGPRIIDLDILLFDEIAVDEDGLRIPHPFMHERDFVLRPLNDIAPAVLHPLLKLTVSELWDLIKKDSGNDS